MVTGDSQPHAMVLPTNERDIAELILKLLGKGRIIGKTTTTAFFIDLQGLTNLHHSIQQRVTGQNQAALSSFDIQFEFDDGHRYVLNSIEQFLNTTFMQNRPCLIARMTWIYIVTFATRAPERQRITIEFAAGDGVGKVGERRGPHIFWEIEHTEVTWGYDLFRHIEHYLSSYGRAEPWLLTNTRRILEEYNIIILYATLPIMMIWNTWRSIGQVQYRQNLSGDVTLATLNEKIEYLITKGDSFSVWKVMLGMIICTTGLFFAIYFMRNALVAFNQGCIILNASMERALDAIRGRVNKSRCYAVLGFVVAAFAGICGNTFYDVIKTVLVK